MRNAMHITATITADTTDHDGDHIADARPGFLAATALEPDADLRAVVATEDGSVLDEGDF